MNPRRVLVTGASGFVGRRLLQALDATGHWRCDALVRPGGSPVVGTATPHVRDLCDADAFSGLPIPDAIVHLATPSDREAPLHQAVRINVDATARLVDWVQAHRIPCLLHVSTASVYAPAPASRVLDEGDALVSVPCPPYPLTKRQGEEVVFLARSPDTAVAILRPGVVYGPGARASNVVARLAAALEAGEQVPLCGDEGHALSPLFVDDLTDVIVGLLDLWRTSEGADTQLNVGGPETVSEAELARRVARALRVPLAFVPEAGRPLSLALSTARLDALLPERTRTPLADGLRRTLD